MCFLKILEIHNDGSSPSGHPKRDIAERQCLFFVREREQENIALIIKTEKTLKYSLK